MNEDDNIISEKLGIVSYEWRKAQNGNDYLAVLLSNREYANCFDKDAIAIITEPANKGATFKLAIKSKQVNNRMFYTIVSVDGVTAPPVASSPISTGASTSQKDKQIKAAVAHKEAVSLACAGKIDMNQILEFSKKFMADLTELEK